MKTLAEIRRIGHASVSTTEGYYIARGAIDAADVEGLRFGIETDAEPTPKDKGRETA